MEKDKLKDFAKTKHGDLPEKLDETTKKERMARNIDINEFNKKETIKYIVEHSTYTEEDLIDLDFSDLEQIYLSIDVKTLETNIMKFDTFVNENTQTQEEQKLQGGVAEGVTLEDIATKHQIDVQYFYKILEDAIKIELEHSSERSIAEQIVRDHIYENPLYYHEQHGLPAMEEKLEDMNKEEVDEVISSEVEQDQQIKKFDEYDS